MFQEFIYTQHLDGIAPATVERYFERHLQRSFAEWHTPRCPKNLAVDEHFFTRAWSYATTLCDLKGYKVYDVVLERSEASLDRDLQSLQGKVEVELVAMDLSATYRAIVHKHFPNARIVADRVDVIGLVNHHFLLSRRDLDPVGSRNPGLLKLMRRHEKNLVRAQAQKLASDLALRPVLEANYAFKQRLCDLLLLETAPEYNAAV